MNKIPNSRQIARKLCINPVDAGELVEGIEDMIEDLGNGDCRNLRRKSSDELAEYLNDYLHISSQKKWDCAGINREISPFL